MEGSVGFIIAICTLQLVTAQTDGPIVNITSGPIQGKIVATHYGTNVHSFYGIPFANPPVSDLRFERPVPVHPWENVLECFDLPYQCMQNPEGILWITHPGFNKYSEDCLNLNVFAPENMSPDEPYPVMVYFYGGAFNSGGNIQYPGHFIAARGIVVVVVNYRVDIFGFLNTEDETNPGNSGLYDQVLGLQWAGFYCLGHAPVEDGPGNFLPDDPLTLREQGEYAQVPLMSGWNAEDGSLYVYYYIPEAMEGGFNRSEFSYLLYDRYLTIWIDSLTPEQVADVYWAVNFYYTPWPYIEDEDLNRDAFVDMTTDCAFGYPSDRQLKLQSRVAPSYQFIFGYRSTNTSDGIWEGTEWAGVPHSGEIPYFWGWPLLKLSPEVRANSKIIFDIVDWNEDDFEYAEFTIDLITNFAKYFDPTPEPVEAPLGHGPITWPALTEDELNYIWIHIDDVEARVNYKQKEMAFFREYISYIMDREILQTDDKPKKGLDTSILNNAQQKIIHKMLKERLPLDFDSNIFN